MGKKARIAGPGLIINRHAKNSKIEIAFDPSPEGFVSSARRENARLKLVIVPGNGCIDPIEMTVSPKIWVFKFERAQVPSERLADLEALITEEQDVHCVLEYTPRQQDLPFATAEPTTTQGETPHTEAIEIKCKGMKLAYLKAVLVCEGAGAWRLGYEAQCGNYSQTKDAKEGPAFDSRTAALNALHFSASTWIDSIELTGSADQKRSLSARKSSWWSQVKEMIDAKVREGQPAEVPFEEDDPPSDERQATSDEEKDDDEDETEGDEE